MKSRLLTHILAYPRIGEKRELKMATEAYWQGRLSRAELEQTGQLLRRQNWLTQQRAGIDLIPSNDFSFYDQMLDFSCLVGNIPERFGWKGGEVDLDTRFAIARGVRPGIAQTCACGESHSVATFASEMTKWFDTNYHYIVPEFEVGTPFALSSPKIFSEFSEALALGIRTKPVLIGPVTYLMLGKMTAPVSREFDRLDLLERLLPVYIQVLQKLADLGAEWVQLDEPVFSLDLTAKQHAALITAYATLSAAVPKLKLLVANYFGGLGNNFPIFLRLPVHALHADLTRAPQELDALMRDLPSSKLLSLGVVDGRNIWRNNYSATLPLVEKAVAILGPDRLLIAPSCSLQHVPVTLRHETRLDAEFKSWLAFAEEKIGEVVALRNLTEGRLQPELLAENQRAISSRQISARIHRQSVKSRVTNIVPMDLNRTSAFSQRQQKQREKLGLPLFPTTTIGSFPQTASVRAARAKWKKGELSDSDYERFLEDETTRCVRFQENAGLDVLVHGEFERNDMVEYFGEQLVGFAFTVNGWVQSYGSRCVKPPIIYGDVARTHPLTVRWATFAQSLTPRPMKGMLTGPITMLQWSFVRDDQSRRDTAFQIALALRDEVLDLEKADIAIIQIDEPALREGLPLHRNDWPDYLKWAVDAFRLTASGVRDDTQIHTHMCYCEFNDIIEAIARLDADVITIETSRSNMELLQAFVNFRYPNEIGPGVYDIHSPRVPHVEEMDKLLAKATQVLPSKNLWVNPDCGLKTRNWEEVAPALNNLVQCARIFRERHSPPPAKS